MQARNRSAAGQERQPARPGRRNTTSRAIRTAAAHPLGQWRTRGSAGVRTEDIARRIDDASRPGPRREPAHLELRDLRPSIARNKGKRSKIRLRNWYIIDGPKRETTRCSENEYPQAQAALAVYEIRKDLGLLGKSLMAGEVTFVQVIRDQLRTLKEQADTAVKLRTWENCKAMAAILLRWWAFKDRKRTKKRTLGDYTKQDSLDFRRDYIRERKAYYADNPDVKKRNPASAASAALRMLRRFVRDCVQNRGIQCATNIYVPPAGKKAEPRWLTTKEYGRLLQACRGRIWDRKAGRWMTRKVKNEDGTFRTTHVMVDEKTAARYRMLSRGLRIAVRSGSRHEVVLSLTWGRRPYVAGFSLGADGEWTIHRRGYREADTTKPRLPSPVSEELAILLWIWARQDGYLLKNGRINTDRNGYHKYVVRKTDNTHYLSPVNQQFAELVRNAGLDSDITMHTCKHTAVSWANQSKYECDLVAHMLGTTEETLRKIYKHWGPEKNKAAKSNFDDKKLRKAFRLLRANHAEAEADDKVRRHDKPYRPRRKAARTARPSRRAAARRPQVRKPAKRVAAHSVRRAAARRPARRRTA